MDDLRRNRWLNWAGIRMEAQVSFLCENGKEEQINIQGDKWIGNAKNDLSIRVYDDVFYHKVLFSARNITRENKENFNEFVIGESGVEKAKGIATKKQLKGQITRERGKLQKDAFSGINDIEAFISLTGL